MLLAAASAASGTAQSQYFGGLSAGCTVPMQYMLGLAAACTVPSNRNMASKRNMQPFRPATR